MIYCDFKKLVFMCSELLHNSYLVSALSFSCCHSSIFVFIRSPSLPFQALSLHFYYCRPSRVCFSVYHRHFSHDEAHVLRSCQPVSGLSYSRLLSENHSEDRCTVQAEVCWPVISVILPVPQLTLQK